MKRPRRIVILQVGWDDAAVAHGWRERKDGGLIRNLSVGFVVTETPKILSLAQSIGENGAWGEILTIPKSNIWRRRKLGWA